MKLLVGLFFSCGLLFGMVDINKADIKELTTLKGIGKAKAMKVIEYRQKHGCFKDTTDLAKVKGIGQGIVKMNQKMIKITACK